MSMFDLNNKGKGYDNSIWNADNNFFDEIFIEKVVQPTGQKQLKIHSFDRLGASWRDDFGIPWTHVVLTIDA